MECLPLAPTPTPQTYLLSFAGAHTSGLIFKMSECQMLELHLLESLFPLWCGAPTAWAGNGNLGQDSWAVAMPTSPSTISYYRQRDPNS